MIATAAADAPNTKLCRGCQTVKPRSEFRMRSATSDVPRPRCKVCMDAAYAYYRGKHKDIDKLGRKRCTLCRKFKPECDFRWRPSESRYYARCKTCEAVAAAIRREAPEHKAMCFAYQRSEAGRACQRRHYMKPEVKARAAENLRAWRATPRGKCLMQVSNLKYAIGRETDARKLSRLQARLDNWRHELARLDALAPPIIDPDPEMETSPCRRRQRS